jgi:hypothetical protein
MFRALGNRRVFATGGLSVLVAFSGAISCSVFVVDYFAVNFHYVQIIGVQFTVVELRFYGYQFLKLTSFDFENNNSLFILDRSNCTHCKYIRTLKIQ